MGAVEEGGKVATGTVEALKGSPNCLAAIVLAGLFAVLTFMALQLDQDRKTQVTVGLIQRCMPQHRGPPDE